MDITVYLRPDVAAAFHDECVDAVPGAAELRALLDRLELSLHALHPGTLDPGLQSWFRVPVPESMDAAALVRALGALRAVESAYLQPIPEAP